jgi:hypothetical protein
MEFKIALALAEMEVYELKSKPPEAFPWSWQLMQFACIMGMTSFEKEIVSLHCAARGVTFSRVQEKRAIEQEEKAIKPTINRAVIFI